jgi:hypothetical protein
MSPQALWTLQAFQSENKFAEAAWKARGLNPSDSAVSARLNSLFQECTATLITQLQQGATTRQLQQTLLAGLRALDREAYDTEEREFIVAGFVELAQPVDVALNEALSAWLYGDATQELLKGLETSKPEKAAETLSQACTKCQAVLETFLLEKQQGIPAACFIVAQCQVCTALNLIEVGDGFRQIRFGNYNALQHLARRRCTREQAEATLEQLKKST